MHHLLRSLASLLRRALLLLLQNLVLHHLLPGQAFRCDRQRMFKAIPHFGQLLPRHPVRRLEQRDPLALLRQDKDIQFVRVRRLQADRPDRARPKVIDRPLRRDKFVPVVLQGREAALREDIHRVPAVAVSEEGVPGNRDPLAASALAQQGEPEFRKPNRASLSMRGNRPRVAGRSSRNVMRKASASCIQCAREPA